MATEYGTVAGVRTRTGVKPEDLAIESNEALDAFLVELLGEATDLMDRRMRKSYLATTIPAGLNGIACDVVADSLRVMVATRQTPIVRIDEFVIRAITSTMLSSDVKERLKAYAKGGGVSSYDVTQGDLAELAGSWTLADLDAE